MLIGADPRDLLHHLLMDSTQIPEQVDDLTLWKVCVKGNYLMLSNNIVYIESFNIHFLLPNILFGCISDHNKYDVRTTTSTKIETYKYFNRCC